MTLTHKKKKRGDNSKSSTKSEKPDEPNAEQSIIPYGRIKSRLAIVILLMIGVYFYGDYTEKLRSFASVSENIERKYEGVACSSDYKIEAAQFPECVPRSCGRMVTDSVVTDEEARLLLRTAKAGLARGGSNGGASILDLHSGALSKGDKFINIFSVMEQTGEKIFSQKDFDTYVTVKNKIHKTIAETFNIPKSKIYLTSPTFFSKMTTKSAKTVHDEYWHVHVDKETYGSFDYTSLLYLTDYGEDFTGGRFVFVEGSKNVTVEPKMGRLSFFTSGSENPHFVEPLKTGTRYAITVSFTCNPEKAISDPQMARGS